MRDYSDDLSALRQRLDEAHKYLKIDAARTRVAELEVEVSKPDLWDDQDRAKAVNAEYASLRDDLDCHRGSPDKTPERRLATLEAAGVLQIPFTTGILVGIGETRPDRIVALEAIAASHRQHGHVQEVIVQNFLPKPGTAMSRTIVDPYLKIQQALANDSVDGVRQNAGEIATAATALGAPAVKIDTTAVQLAAATQLADAREKFGLLSDAIDAYMTGLHLTPPEGVKVAMCPMVNKPWMQEGSAITNPYYGSEMLTCGSFR